MVIVEQLSKHYRAGSRAVPVLQDVNIRVMRGEFVAIMGASGSGKSTLLNVLGLLDGYDRGRYWLDGRDTRRLSDRDAARFRNEIIGFVFQSFHLLPHKTAWENVTLPLIYGGVARRERKRRAYELLERLGVGHRAGHLPNELSGGQRQRVAIARALVTRAPLLLADEPTGNLDSKAALEVVSLFRELHARGQTLVLVTHDAHVARMAARVVHVRDGLVVTDGETPGEHAA
jgi:putative ABC transport system ATP-binding protein